MTNYIVYRREIWVQAVEVQANSKEEALNLVYQGHGDMGDQQPEFLENDIRGSMDLSTVVDDDLDGDDYEEEEGCPGQCPGCRCGK